jgi:hypothetical protein
VDESSWGPATQVAGAWAWGQMTQGQDRQGWSVEADRRLDYVRLVAVGSRSGFWMWSHLPGRRQRRGDHEAGSGDRCATEEREECSCVFNERERGVWRKENWDPDP